MYKFNSIQEIAAFFQATRTDKVLSKAIDYQKSKDENDLADLSEKEQVFIKIIVDNDMFKPVVLGKNKVIPRKQLIELWDDQNWDVKQNELRPNEIIVNGQHMTTSEFCLHIITNFDFDIKTSELEEVVNVKAKKYNPISNFLSELDTKDCAGAIDEYASKVKTDTPNFNLHFKKHLVRAVKQVFEGGLVNKHCLTLISSQHHIGKTSYLANLFDIAEFKGYIKPGGVDIGSKDARISISTNFAIIMDEIDQYINKKDVAVVKSLLGAAGVSERAAYARREEQKERIASFFATANKEILNDETGNVRFLCFDVDKIDFSYKHIDIKKVWAEAYLLYINNFDCTINKEEFKELEHSSKFAEVETYEDSIIAKEFKQVSRLKLKDAEFWTKAQIVNYLQALNTNVKITPYLVFKALKKVAGTDAILKVDNKSLRGFYVVVDNQGFN